MHPAYFTALFDPHGFHGPWPDSFVILSAWATTGETWTEEACARADRLLRGALEDAGHWHCRVTGYAPDHSHAEPGWAVAMDFEAACDLGLRFRQVALYLVEGDDLSVSHCDARRGRVPVGPFRERLRPR